MLDKSTENPPLTPLLRAMTFIEVLVLITAGGGLFFLTDLTRAQWPWNIRPFNAHFVGAVYLASLMSVAIMFINGRWVAARLVLPMLFTFTSIVFVMSLLKLDTFLYDRWTTWVWFILYLVLPLNAAYHLWLYRRLLSVEPTPPQPWVRYALLIMGSVMGAYGLVQFFAPEAASAFWPWKIDAFHGQMYSATFVTAAVGAFVLSLRATAPIEYFTLGLTYGILGFFCILGLVIVDASAHAVDWGAAGTWLWVVAFALTLIVGLVLLWQSHTFRKE